MTKSSTLKIAQLIIVNARDENFKLKLRKKNWQDGEVYTPSKLNGLYRYTQVGIVSIYVCLHIII